MAKARIAFPKKKLVEFCRKNQIKSLSLFGSVLSDDFNMDSDVDVLVEFMPGRRIGLIGLSRLEYELGEIIGRNVDLNTPDFISKYFRSDVMATKEIQYAEA